ncbi:hypothetical protein, conserved [Eimeria brunetti]|uniref:Uncharacterized protein n=1 Tax=Eimeria brunetti TaxID=51314 RepID=U6LM11_9EIME|nr:hypothetical protein, conserved [Eimeria brunetti]
MLLRGLFFCLFCLFSFVSGAEVMKEGAGLLVEVLKEAGLDLSSPQVLEALSMVQQMDQDLLETVSETGGDSSKSTTEDDKYLLGALRQLKKIRGSSWFKALVKKSKQKQKNNECMMLKEEGIIPQAKNAPLKSFGYPRFDTNTKKMVVFPGVALTRVNNFLAPIKVGAQDFVIQGDAPSVLLFLDCFSQYEVIGSVLTEGGHWDSTPQSQSPVYIQLQNTGPEAFNSVREMLLHQSLNSLLKTIGPTSGLVEGLQEAAGSSSSSSSGSNAGALGIKGIKKTRKYLTQKWWWLKQVYGLASLLGVSTGEAKQALKEISRQQTFAGRARRFLQLLQQAQKRDKQQDSEMWRDSSAISLNEPFTLTITMYPKPSHNVRATAALSSSRVSVAEVFAALSKFFLSKGIGDSAADLAQLLK